MGGDGENGGDSVLNFKNKKNNYNRAPVTQTLKGNEKQFWVSKKFKLWGKFQWN